MKNIFLLFFTILSFQSFAQNDFRKMNWGDSPEQLRANYPNIDWETNTEYGNLILSTDDNVGGLATTIMYIFIDNKLKIGGYEFKQTYSSKNLYYDDYMSISNILKDKYEMVHNETWNNDLFKDDKNSIGQALFYGHVEISETSTGEKTIIMHSISGNNLKIEHGLVYADFKYMKKQSDKRNDDF